VVRRSTNPQGPFDEIASWNGNSAPQYADQTASNGVTGYYVVAARNQAGVSKNSETACAQAVAAGPLPVGWTNASVGMIGEAGTAMYAEAGGNTFVASGTTGDIGGKTDALNFTHCAVPGDFVFTARLLDTHWTGQDKIGLMVRESNAPGAKAVTVTLGGIGSRQCRFGVRADAARDMTWQAGNDYTWEPVWFRLRRTGNVFTGYQSIDGANWFKVGASTVPFSNQCLVGMGIAAQKNNVLNTTVFDHVTVECALK
jgi:regulation of enolase protein 1 (concanavalin A-like superfamily)